MSPTYKSDEVKPLSLNMETTCISSTYTVKQEREINWGKKSMIARDFGIQVVQTGTSISFSAKVLLNSHEID